MMELSIKYLVCIKEEKDPELYKQFIEKVVQHISALDTSVRDVQADDVLVTIKDTVLVSLLQRQTEKNQKTMMMTRTP